MMEKVNIPIYRAEILGSKKTIEGYYLPNYYDIYTKQQYSNIIFCENDFLEIDPTTLAIHFPDMLDSSGNKIFASLSEDGKGGDIIEQEINMYLDDPRPHNGTYWVQTKCPILYKHRSIYVKYDIKDATPKFADGTITNRHGYKTISNIFETKVIGIQK